MRTRFILLLTIGLLVALHAYGACAGRCVQDISGTATLLTALDLTFASNVTAGNCIVGGSTWLDNSKTLDSVAYLSGTATLGATQLLNNPTAIPSSERSGMYVIPITGTGSLVLRLTHSGSMTKYSSAHEANGLAAACTVLGSALASQTDPGTGTDALTSGSVGATSTAADYFFGYFFNSQGSGVTLAAGTNFTLGVVRANLEFTEYSSTAGLSAATATWNSATNDPGSGGVLLAGASTGPSSRLLMGCCR